MKQLKTESTDFEKDQKLLRDYVLRLNLKNFLLMKPGCLIAEILWREA